MHFREHNIVALPVTGEENNNNKKKKNSAPSRRLYIYYVFTIYYNEWIITISYHTERWNSPDLLSVSLRRSDIIYVRLLSIISRLSVKRLLFILYNIITSRGSTDVGCSFTLYVLSCAFPNSPPDRWRSIQSKREW